MKLIWTSDARIDRAAIWLFLADYGAEHADRITQRLKDRAESLIDFPRLGSPVAGSEVRELSVPDINYVISYRVSGNAIYVLRVWHMARDRA